MKLSLYMYMTVVIFLASAVIVSAQFKRICYYSIWDIFVDKENALMPENIEPFLCTHIVVAFVTLDESGTRPVMPSGYRPFNLLRRFSKVREQNKRINFLVSLGGWDHSSVAFHKLMSSQKNMQKFASNTIHFLRANDFDGLDIDWEYPGTRGSDSADKIKFYKFLRLVKWEFDYEEQPDLKWKLSLSISVNPKVEDAKRFYWSIPKYARHVHWVNIKAFNIHGPWDSSKKALHPNPLIDRNDPQNSVNGLAQYWVNEGVPLHKVIIGINLEGMSYELANRSNSNPGAAVNGSGSEKYPVKKICQLIMEGAHELTDQNTQMPYMVYKGQWIGYDNPHSARQKAELVFNNQLGGVSFWNIGMDDFQGKCGKKYPVLNAVLDGLDERNLYESTKLTAEKDKAQHDFAIAEVKRVRNAAWDAQDITDKIYKEPHNTAHV